MINLSTKPMEEIKYIVIHASATKPSMDIGADEIRRWHLQKGWFDIGYHYVIRRDGLVEKGRDDDRPGAHVRGVNQCSLGICLIGGISERNGDAENNYTEEQMATLERLVVCLKVKHKKSLVVGHRDFPGVKKACPCFDAIEWYDDILAKQELENSK